MASSLLESPAEASALESSVVTADRDQLVSYLREDFNSLAAIAAPDIFTLAFPAEYIQLWLLVREILDKDRDFSKYNIGFPRGFAKTTYLKILILYIIVYSKKKFILIVCASAALAQNVIADVVDLLDSENIQTLFGNWRYDLATDRQDFKKFKLLGRDIMLKGVGVGTSVRGIAVKFKRPDVIICDDAQTKECAMNPISAKEYINWFFGTLMKAKNPTSCTYLYIGNMYPNLLLEQPKPGRAALHGCLLRNLKDNPQWVSFIVGGILADGTSLWEELQPIDQLLDEFAQDKEFGQEATFLAEVLNDPDAHLHGNLLFSQLAPFPIEETIPTGKFIIIDPAGWKTLTNKTTDKVAITYNEIRDGIPVVIEVVAEKMTPLDTIMKSFKLCTKYNCAHIFVESVAYQNTLIFWFEEIFSRMQIRGIDVREVLPGMRAKNARIQTFFEAWMKGEIGVGPDAFTIVLSQARNFDPTTNQNIDDILDCCAYAHFLLLKHKVFLETSMLGQGVAAGLNSPEQSLSGVPLADDYLETSPY